MAKTPPAPKQPRKYGEFGPWGKPKKPGPGACPTCGAVPPCRPHKTKEK